MSSPLLNARGDELLLGGDLDPTSIAVDAVQGAIYVREGATPGIFQKQDNGQTTNWLELAVGDFMARDFSNAQAAANDIDLGSNKIVNLADPTVAQDAATKNYVDTQVGAITPGDAWGDPVDADIVPDSDNSRSLGTLATKFSGVNTENLIVGNLQQFVNSGGSPTGLIAAALVSPSGVSSSFGIQEGTATVGEVVVMSLNSGVNDANPTKNILIESGNKTSGTGDSGDIKMTTGSSSGGNRGNIYFDEESLPGASNGFVWTLQDNSTGEGAWAAVSGGANTSLSNISSVDLSADLVSSSARFFGSDNVSGTPPTVTFGAGFDTGTGTYGDVNIGGNGAGNPGTGTVTIGDIDQVTISPDSNATLSPGFNLELSPGNDIVLAADIIPDTANTYDLGSLSSRLNTVRSSSLVAQGSGSGVLTFQTDIGLPLGTISGNLTTPTGVSNCLAIRDDNSLTGDVAVITNNNSSANADPTKSILIETGNKTAGSGDSGNINLVTGTSSGGSRGIITLDALVAVLPTATADPSTSNPDGSAYYKTDTNELRVLNGGTWRGVTLT